MRTRITRKHLQEVIDHINRIRPPNTYPFRLGAAFGGYRLERQVTPAGGTQDSLGSGYVKARDLHGRMHAYVFGLMDAGVKGSRRK